MSRRWLPCFLVLLGLISSPLAVAQDQSAERTAPMKDEVRARFTQSDYENYLKKLKSGEIPPQGGPVTSIGIPPTVSGAVDILVNNNNGVPNPATRSFIQSETDIIAFGNNVVIAFNDAGSYTGSNNQFTGWSYSTDGGASFTDGGTLPVSTVGDAGDPVLARDNTTGRIYFSTLGFSGSGTIQMFRSDDGGITWMAPTVATPGGSSEDKQWHTVDNYPGTGNGNVYMISRRFGAGPGIYVFRSTDQGATFGPSGGVQIVTGNQGAYIDVGPNHDVYAFWYTTGSIQMRKSTDFGATFGSPVTVASGLVGGTNGDLGLTGIRQGLTTPSGFRSNEFPHSTINPVSGHIYVTYDNDGAGTDKADVYFVMSTDGGTTWSAPLKINDDVTTTDQWQPTIAVTPNGSRLGIFYYSRQDSASNNTFRYYGRIGTISGPTVTWGSASFAISDVSSLPEFGRDAVVNSVYMSDYTHAFATQSAFHVVWSDNRDDLPNGAPRKDPNVYYEKINISDPIDPNPVTNFSAYSSFSTPTSMLLRWTNPTTLVNGTPITPAQFQTLIRRDGVLITTRPGSDSAYTDPGLTTYTSYEYTAVVRLIANDSTSTSASANWIAGGSPIPAAPRLDSLTTNATTARLRWTEPTTQADGTPIHDYIGTVIYRNAVAVDSVGAGVTAYNDTPTPGASYTYTLRARNSLVPRRYSAPSNAMSGFVGPITMSVNPTAVLDTLQVAQTHSKSFTISNTTSLPGGPLFVTITETVPWLTVSPVADTINPAQSQVVSVNFNATGLVPGTYNTNAVVASNSSTPSVNVAVTLTVVPSPTIVTRPDSLVRTLDSAQTATDTLTIRNTGAGPLTWGIAEVPGPEPQAAFTRQPQADELYPPRRGMDGLPLPQTKGEADIHYGPNQEDGQGGPDSAGYRWIDSDEPGGPVYNWVDITGVGTPITGWNNGDDGYVVVPFPFTFRFYGVDYGSQLKVVTNGWLSFDVVSTNAAFTNVAIPATAAPNLFIAPFWDDLDLRTSGSVHYYHDAVNQRFIVQYTAVPHFSTGGPYTFQVHIRRDGSLLYQYRAMATPVNSATIGIENQGGTVGLQVVFNAAYLHDSLAISIASDVSWISENPTSGSIAPGDSQKVAVTFNSTGLAAGTYRGRLQINSNDYTNTPKYVPIRLTVSGTPPPAPVVEARADHLTSTMRVTITNEGNVGFLNAFPPTGPGSGFQFNPLGTQRLFEGSLMIATDSNHVSDAARGNTSPEALDADFKFLSNIDTLVTGVRRRYRTSYSDSLAETPLYLKLDQTSFSFDTVGLANALIMQMDVTNLTGSTINGLTFGGYFDWDVDPATAQDRGQVVVDSTNTIAGVNGGNPFNFELMELHQGASPNAWVGIVPLSENRFKARRIAIQSTEIYPPHMTKGDKWTYLNFNRPTNPNGDNGTNVDHGQVWGQSSFNLASSGTKRLGFGVVAGNSLAAIVQQAREAQRAWVLRLGNTLQIVTGVDQPAPLAEIPGTYELAQNYPNPFNPSTTIRYGLPEQSTVSLRIYNLLGQLVTTLTDEVQEAGYHTRIWNGRTDAGVPVSTGIYFYRIDARSTTGGHFSDMKKMIILK